MKRKIALLIGFLAMSQGLAMADDVFNPGKPIIGYSWLQQLSALAERVFAWL